MKLDEFIIKIADKNTENQREDGSFPAGINGPYNDPETPVRNTGHWLITYSKCYKLTKDKSYISIIRRSVNYLTSDIVRPFKATFHHRNKLGKDSCNGLIGQSWSIEALIEAYKILKESKYIKIAEKVFDMHKYDKKQNLWHIQDIDNTTRNIDLTFNHQLWFAYASAYIGKSSVIEVIKSFLDNITNILELEKSGLILHPVKSCLLWNKSILGKIKRIIFSKNKNFRYKSIGYQSFNLYAFSLLKNILPKHLFWKSSKFKKIIKYTFSRQYKKEVIGNKYSYPYNAPGFEMPVIIQLLKLQDESIDYWINKQIELTFDKDTFTFSRRTNDPITLTARIYELTRLSDDLIRKIEIELS